MTKYLFLILIAFACGVYVGRLPVVDRVLGNTGVTGQESNISQDTNTSQNGRSAQPSSAEGSVVVSANQLSSGQRELLTKLGIDANAITLTPEMIACAEAKLGAERLAVITGGATPTVAEGFSLLTCYR